MKKHFILRLARALWSRICDSIEFFISFSLQIKQYSYNNSVWIDNTSIKRKFQYWPNTKIPWHSLNFLLFKFPCNLQILILIIIITIIITTLRTIIINTFKWQILYLYYSALTHLCIRTIFSNFKHVTRTNDFKITFSQINNDQSWQQGH